MSGCTYALHTVVLIRSYSRISGATSLESEKVAWGMRSASQSRAASSCAGLVKAFRKQIATLPTSSRTPASSSMSSIGSRLVGSNGSTSSPNVSSLSSASKRRKRGTRCSTGPLCRS